MQNSSNAKSWDTTLKCELWMFNMDPCHIHSGQNSTLELSSEEAGGDSVVYPNVSSDSNTD